MFDAPDAETRDIICKPPWPHLRLSTGGQPRFFVRESNPVNQNNVPVNRRETRERD